METQGFRRLLRAPSFRQQPRRFFHAPPDEPDLGRTLELPLKEPPESAFGDAQMRLQGIPAEIKLARERGQFFRGKSARAHDRR